MKFKISAFLIVLIFAASNCGQNSKKNINNDSSTKSSEDYLKAGMDIALAAKAVLGKNLMTAMQKDGPDGALAFCNERAIPLTDSIATDLNASIRRVSDKNRNTGNAANNLELAYINQAKADISELGKAKPKIQEVNNKMVGYYPIVTNGMCLKCHGDPNTDIDKKTMDVLNSKYPKDLAVGYMVNELRGIWVIEMDK